MAEDALVSYWYSVRIGEARRNQQREAEIDRELQRAIAANADYLRSDDAKFDAEIARFEREREEAAERYQAGL